MGLNYRKRIRLSRRSGLNLSKSGVSFSHKVGPVTFNSRGRTTVKLGNGWSYTMTSKSMAGCGCFLLLAVLFLLARFFWVILAVGLVGWLGWKLFGTSKPPTG